MTPAEQEAADRARRKEELKAAYLEDMRAIEASRQQARRYGRQNKIQSALARVENMAEAIGVSTADLLPQPSTPPTLQPPQQTLTDLPAQSPLANTPPEVLAPRTLGIPATMSSTANSEAEAPAPTQEPSTDTELRPRTLGI
jgi:hypothetical protein